MHTDLFGASLLVSVVSNHDHLALLLLLGGCHSYDFRLLIDLEAGLWSTMLLLNGYIDLRGLVKLRLLPNIFELRRR